MKIVIPTHDRADSWDARHDALVNGYDAAVHAANRALEEDVRLPYGKLKAIYDAPFEAARPLMFDIFERGYAPRLMREGPSGLLCELHRADVVSDKRLLALDEGTVYVSCGARGDRGTARAAP